MIRLFVFAGAHPDFEAECSIHVFDHKGCVRERGEKLGAAPRIHSSLADENTPVEV